MKNTVISYIKYTGTNNMEFLATKAEFFILTFFLSAEEA